jgi:uncharacterized membrane protein AbrB (regulator of aidB expression)
MTYNRRERMTVEIVILICSSALFALATAYIVKLWHVPLSPWLFGSEWGPDRPRPISQKRYKTLPYAQMLSLLSH